MSRARKLKKASREFYNLEKIWNHWKFHGFYELVTYDNERDHRLSRMFEKGYDPGQPYWPVGGYQVKHSQCCCCLPVKNPKPRRGKGMK
jgi:hypothetical protein